MAVLLALLCAARPARSDDERRAPTDYEQAATQVIAAHARGDTEALKALLVVDAKCWLIAEEVHVRGEPDAADSATSRSRY